MASENAASAIEGNRVRMKELRVEDSRDNAGAARTGAFEKERTLQRLVPNQYTAYPKAESKIAGFPDARDPRRERADIDQRRNSDMTRPAAIILSGGKSRRMGRPKAWLTLQGETLLHRVVRLASTAADPVVVVAAAGQALPELDDSVILVRDPIPDLGPLQGLAAGLAALPPSLELAYAMAVDAPFLDPAWIGRLVDLIGDHDAATPRIEERRHPLASLYRVRPAREAAQSLLDEGGLRLTALVDRLRARDVSADELRLVDPGLRSLRNLNTPADYRDARNQLDNS